ncbi:MAG: hypothetical protein ACUVQG_10130, partial [Thermogutta sp.]
LPWDSSGRDETKNPVDNYEVINRDFVARLRKEGYEFHVWRIDDGQRAKVFRDLGWIQSPPTVLPSYGKSYNRGKSSGNRRSADVLAVSTLGVGFVGSGSSRSRLV